MFGKKSGIALIAVLMLAACGKNAFDVMADKNSSAATKEKAQIAINNGDYASAIDILKGMCPNNACPDTKTAQMLAAAYMGATGLNVLDLAKNADTNRNGGAAGSNFTAISRVLSALIGNLVHIVSAIDVLSHERTTMGMKPRAANAACLGGYTDQQKDLLLQLGIAEVSAAVISIGSQLGGFGANGIPVACTGGASPYCAGNSTLVANALNAAYTPPGGATTTYASFSAKSLTDGANALNCAFGGSAATGNVIVKTINDVAYDVETNNCAGTAPVPYQPNITGANVIAYVRACL